ncbi:hypothetical protein BSU04_15730 [Caballeronia sordidicola]|uniref:Uncharacterized protein n=1 Tax=Caballeronia sordidicola TaxID=196367 RepID=A0A226X4A5_CABSO|nr:hypothetical protein BSU04_15730 [Caballeronia sordidicola]
MSAEAFDGLADEATRLVEMRRWGERQHRSDSHGFSTTDLF